MPTARPPKHPRLNLVVLCLLCLAVVACSDDTRDSTCIDDSVDIDCSGRLEVSETQTGLPQAHGALLNLPVAAAAHGEAVNLRLVLRNTAAVASAAPLNIIAIKLVEDPAPEGGAPAFQCFNSDASAACADLDRQWQPVVPSGATMAGAVSASQVLIRYTRNDDAERSAQLHIVVSGDPTLEGNLYVLRLVAMPGTPRLKMIPDVLHFGPLPAGESQEQTMGMVNQGDASLLVHRLDLLAPAGFKLRTKSEDGGVLTHEASAGKPLLLSPPLSIPSGTGHDIVVIFTANDDKQRQGTLRVGSNDNSPGGGVAQLVANANLPCIKVIPAGGLDFGAVQVGGQALREIVLRNCGGSPLVIHGIDLDAGNSSPEFDVVFDAMKAQSPQIDAEKGPTQEAPITLGPNAKASFTVRYQPSVESALDPATNLPAPDLADVRVFSNALHKVNTIHCRGVGVLQVCPTAKIKVLEGEEVVPQTNLHLVGDESFATGGGQVTKYKWQATKQPAGSMQVFLPSTSFPNPTFAVNTVGQYEFTLRVWDAAGTESCEDAKVQVLVLPDKAIHIELLWNTPADPDQTDSGPGAGADLDLHFAHALANGPDIDCDGQPDPWFSNPFDIFWFNKTANWGSSTSEADNPTLDLDDTDGAGPENLNLDQPEGTVSKPKAYDVGVHYWNDHGFGVSYATVNIYVVGVLAVQYANVALKPLDMWYVGRLNWPNTMSGGSQNPLSTCHQTVGAKPCDGQGKWWQPQGEHCITPCYINPAFVGSGMAQGCVP